MIVNRDFIIYFAPTNDYFEPIFRWHHSSYAKKYARRRNTGAQGKWMKSQAVKDLQNMILRTHTHHLLHGLAVPEEDQGGDAHDPELGG